MRRREFLAGLSAAGLAAACGAPKTPPLPPITLGGAGHRLGHRLASADFPAPSKTIRTKVAIVGGGIGGLSTAWRLARDGMDDFLLFELESSLGGNSRAGSNAISAFPLAAHYLPLPPREAVATRELLRELGALKGSGDRLADYEETLLAQAPQERLLIDGWWQDGLWPTHRVPATERAQYARFQAYVADLRGRKPRPFALPLERSSTATEWRNLDRETFRDWLLRQNYTAPGLHWLANYATRDDYGTDYSQTSAWAGLHYFACRGGGDIEGHVLTTPGGNAWLAQGLARHIGQRATASAVVFRVEEQRHHVQCDIYLAAEQRSIRVLAEQLVWAAPLFLVPRCFVNPPVAWTTLAAQSDYAPWVVVNLSLSAPPHTRAGVGLAWDNVIRDSASLGYVVTTHQAMRYAPGPTVLTWYRALSEPGVTPSRQRRLLQDDPAYWAEAALADLSLPHPEIRELVSHIHVHAHGHAMIRPTPGTLWHPARTALKLGSARIRCAHADASGISLFEEANQRGVLAAEQILRRFRLRASDALG